MKYLKKRTQKGDEKFTLAFETMILTEKNKRGKYTRDYLRTNPSESPMIKKI